MPPFSFPPLTQPQRERVIWVLGWAVTTATGWRAFPDKRASFTLFSAAFWPVMLPFALLNAADELDKDLAPVKVKRTS